VPPVGRAEELRILHALVAAARNGQGGSLVVRGEPGIGKTTLLRSVTRLVGGIRLLSADGYEAESDLPFAGVQRIMMPLAGRVDALPPRFASALAVATGQTDGAPPDPFLVGLALLAVLVEEAKDRPVVCVVDDAHLLDTESLGAVTFVARRVRSEGILLLFALRDGSPADTVTAGLPELRLSGLDGPAAVELLNRSSDEALDPVVALRVAEETGGNPLALVDLARDLPAGRLATLSRTGGPIPVGRHLEDHYLRVVRSHGDDVQEWLLVAAAAGGGDPTLVARASERLGIPPTAGLLAEHDGLVSVGTTIRFRHPLVRSAVYGGASPDRRRRAHAALAREATERRLVELAAWHGAEAAFGTDDDAADRLEHVADRAGRRGGYASRARLLARSADLTPSGPRRAGRLLDAAEAAGLAGAARLALDLVGRVPDEHLDEVQRGRMIAVRASLVAFLAEPTGVTRATADMIVAADLFAAASADRERRALLAAFHYALPAERCLAGTTIEALGERIRAILPDAPDDTLTIVLTAVASHILDPYAVAAPLMRRALEALRDVPDDELLDYNVTSAVFAAALWDVHAGRNLHERFASVARERGSLRLLDASLWTHSLFELSNGDPAGAGRTMTRVRELRRSMGFPAEHVVNAAQLAWSGTPAADVLAIADAMLALGFGGVHSSAVTAVAIQEIAGGHYRDAFERLGPFLDQPFLQASYYQLADYVEAAERSGHHLIAAETTHSLSVFASANDSPLLHGLLARCRAVLSADVESAESLYLTALDTLDAASAPVDLGRAYLLYGEWLRRRKRRRDARDRLRTAIDIFERHEAPAFADRARSELEKTGERIGVPSTDGLGLTPQETAVARLAAAGRTNAEIAAALYISVNTVDYHLRKVFQKLGVSSRRRLSDRIDGREG
jgi:DNA-binding CsgD family transcriptional regulator